MTLTLDHLVVLADDLQQAVDQYIARGFVVTPGGTHADGLTHNALIVFGDSTYLELIAFLDAADTRDNVWGWRQYGGKGGGLIDYCLVTDDLEQAVAGFKQRGLPVGNPTAGGRKRPDGMELRWRSARFWQAGRELPFLIEDITPRELRVPPSIPHPNGVTGMHELLIAVADLPRLSRTFSTLLDCATPASQPHRRYDATATSFQLGRHVLTLATPASKASPLQQRLETLGLGPAAVTLTSANGASTAGRSVTQTWFGSALGSTDRG